MFSFFVLVEVLLLTLHSGEACDADTWHCHDGRRCIGMEYVCDGLIHCRDASDEKPEVCNTWLCVEGRWKCRNNKCIPANDVCNTKVSSPIHEVIIDREAREIIRLVM